MRRCSLTWYSGPDYPPLSRSTCGSGHDTVMLFWMLVVAGPAGSIQPARQAARAYLNKGHALASVIKRHRQVEQDPPDKPGLPTVNQLQLTAPHSTWANPAMHVGDAPSAAMIIGRHHDAQLDTQWYCCRRWSVAASWVSRPLPPHQPAPPDTTLPLA
jgi:hypothetical protein